VLNLLYQLRIKSIALQAGVDAIVSERDEMIIRAQALEEIDRRALQRVLGERIKVRRREVRLPPSPELVWRAELVRTLQAIRDLTAS
jgi:hypothetical protein